MHKQWKSVLYARSALTAACNVLGRNRVASAKHVVRWYTVQPPDWLGGKNLLIRSGKYDFPEHAKTFDEKMKGNCLLFVGNHVFELAFASCN